MSDERATKRMRFAGKIVTIQVGTEDPTDFSVHATIIKTDSDFFKLALDKKWKEGQELVVKLPEDSIDLFAIYVEWLYDRAISSESEPVLAKLYVLGEKIQSSHFCNAVITKLRNVNNTNSTVPHIDVVNIMFEGTPPSSPARRYVVDSWKSNGASTWLEDGDYSNEPHPEFVKDLAMAFLRTPPIFTVLDSKAVYYK